MESFVNVLQGAKSSSRRTAEQSQREHDSVQQAQKTYQSFEPRELSEISYLSSGLENKRANFCESQGAKFMSTAVYSAKEVLVPGSAYDRSKNPQPGGELKDLIRA